MELQIKKENKKPMAIALSFCWVFLVYLFWLIPALFHDPGSVIRETEAHFFFYPFLLSIVLYFLLFGLIFQIIGFSLGMKREGIALFIFPFFAALLPFILFILVCLIVPGAYQALLALSGLTRVTCFFVFCSLIISTFVYFKKERLLFKVIGVLLLFLIIFGVVMATTKPLSKYTYQQIEQIKLTLEFLKAGAISNNDPEFCEKIEKLVEEKSRAWWMDWRQKNSFMSTYYEPCVEEIAVNLRDEALCNKLLTGLRDDCVKKIAIKEINPQLCEELRFDQDDCILGIIDLTNDPDLCKKLSYEHKRNNCIIELSLRLNNPDLCKEIEKKVTQEACYRNFEK